MRQCRAGRQPLPASQRERDWSSRRFGRGAPEFCRAPPVHSTLRASESRRKGRNAQRAWKYRRKPRQRYFLTGCRTSLAPSPAAWAGITTMTTAAGPLRNGWPRPRLPRLPLTGKQCQCRTQWRRAGSGRQDQQRAAARHGTARHGASRHGASRHGAATPLRNAN